MNEMVKCVDTIPAVRASNLVSDCLQKLDGDQILFGLGIIFGSGFLTVAVACLTGHDVSVSREGFSAIKQAS